MTLIVFTISKEGFLFRLKPSSPSHSKDSFAHLFIQRLQGRRELKRPLQNKRRFFYFFTKIAQSCSLHGKFILEWVIWKLRLCPSKRFPNHFWTRFLTNRKYLVTLFLSPLTNCFSTLSWADKGLPSIRLRLWNISNRQNVPIERNSSLSLLPFLQRRPFPSPHHFHLSTHQVKASITACDFIFSFILLLDLRIPRVRMTS